MKKRSLQHALRLILLATFVQSTVDMLQPTPTPPWWSFVRLSDRAEGHIMSVINLLGVVESVASDGVDGATDGRSH